MSQFVGNWTHFKTIDGPAFLNAIFPRDAVLEVRTAEASSQIPYNIALRHRQDDLVELLEVEEVPGKLCGQFSFARETFYFELVALDPPAAMVLRGRTLYGVIARIEPGDPGDDLGDPGTWQAEEEGGTGGGKG